MVVNDKNCTTHGGMRKSEGCKSLGVLEGFSEGARMGKVHAAGIRLNIVLFNCALSL